MGRKTKRSKTDWGRWWGVRLPFLCALWMTSFAQNSGSGPVNVATGLPDSAYQQSSKHSWQRHASNGANGNTDGTYSPQNCVNTKDYRQSRRGYIKDNTPWWEVDLGRPTYVYNIKIWGRTGGIYRLYPFTIRVDNKLCVYVTQDPGTREITVNCATPLYGQVVRLTRSTKQQDYFLMCRAGYYGMDCSLPCSDYCTSDGCYMNNGTCITCKPGWYGDQCLTPCPSNCLDGKCDQQSGVCLACEGNFAGDSCTDCNSGMYGESCQHTCSSKTPRCERCDRDGRCTSCDNNLKPPDCTECPARFHGDQCNLNCPQSCVRCEQDSGQCTECDFYHQPPDCVECLDGYYQQYRSSRWCTQCTGTCLEGTVCDKTSGHCPACPPGKWGTLCRQDCGRGTYGQNCSQQCGRCGQSRACDVKDGSCHGCQTGWQMPLCQEKCEDGTYGDGCRQMCGHCKDNSPCHNVNGVCQQCQPGWYPPLCATPCQDGRYGVNCAQICGNCLHGVVCDKTNGHCPCPLGKQPPLCDTNCQDNTYGQDCREKCGQCREGSACEPTNGHCAKGCQPGWTDPAGLTVHRCTSACPAGLYGDQCNQTCGYCHSSSPCHHVTGECQQGCAKGFTGVYCTQACPAGLYGDQCNQMCGYCHSRSPCHHVTGECQQGCAKGFTGVYCMEGQTSESGQEKWHVVVAILGTLVAVLLAVLLAVFICRKRGAARRFRARDRMHFKRRNGTEEQELSNQDAGQLEGNLPVLPAQGGDEGIYSEIDDLPACPYQDAASAMPSTTDMGADGSKQNPPVSKKQMKNKGHPGRNPLKKTPKPNDPAGILGRETPAQKSANPSCTPEDDLTPVNVSHQQPASREMASARQRGNALDQPSVQQPARARGERATPSSGAHGGQRPAHNIQMGHISPTKPTAEYGPEPDSPVTFPSFDLASTFPFNPTEQLHDDSFDEQVAQGGGIYDKSDVYMNTAEDYKPYEKLQHGCDVLYKNC